MSRRAIFFSILGVSAVVVMGLQLVPYGRDHANPPVLTEPAWDSAHTHELFTRACADCHSNATVWPWYSNIAPVSWLVQRDVDEGREKFNVSTGRGEADEAAEKVADGEMPLKIYTLIHPEAKLSMAETRELIQGLQATFGGEGGESSEEDD
jgi:mono/diheme cytochrome c family protein